MTAEGIEAMCLARPKEIIDDSKETTTISPNTICSYKIYETTIRNVEIWAVDVSIGSEIRPDGSQPGGIAKASSGRDSTNWSLFMKIEDLEPEKCEQTAKYEVERAQVIT